MPIEQLPGREVQQKGAHSFMLMAAMHQQGPSGVGAFSLVEIALSVNTSDRQGSHLGEHGSVLHDRLFSLGLLFLSQKWL